MYVLVLLALVLAAMSVVGCARTETTTERIPFGTTQQDDSSMFTGETKTITEGRDGTKQVTWRVTGSGADEKRERVSETITEPPIDAIVAVGTKEMATGYTITYPRTGSARFSMVVTDVRRNEAYGGDTLVVTAHFANLQSDRLQEIDNQLVLLLNGKEIGGYGHLPSERGLTGSVTLRGSEEGDCVFEFPLRLGSTLRADASSVDDFTLAVGESHFGRTKDLYALNMLWIGPIESGGVASAKADSQPVAYDLVQDSVLTVACDPSYPPFESMKGGSIVGFDVDLITAIAEQEGLTVQWETVAFDQTLNWVRDGKADVAVSAISIQESRKQVVDFSDAYLQYKGDSFGIAVAKDNQEILAAVNRGIAALKESGAYKRIRDKWLK